MIDQADWQQLSVHLDQALALAPAEQTVWLANLARHNPALAEQLQALLVSARPESQAGGLVGLDDVAPAITRPATAAAGSGFAWLLNQALDAPGRGEIPGAHPPTPTLQSGQRLGPWQLLHKIGEGGMGQVWLAERADGLFVAQAAIKLLRSDLSAAGLAARFARERAVLARLNHPAVARLLDAGIEAGQAYLVLEYVAGQSLAEHVRRACPLVLQRVRLLLQIGQAVDHAHAQLIVHRDLKPSNVLVTPAGSPKLLDFGIAGLLDDGEPMDTDLTRQTGRGLTVGYAAPEQILGRPIGTAADVFSLGIMLFELLTGEMPFAPRQSTRLAAEHAVLHGEPQRFAALLGLPPSITELGPGRPTDAARALGDLEAITAKALRKDPAQRYGSVRALQDDLTAWLEHRPVSARGDDWRHRSRLWLRRNAVLAGATGVVLLSLTVGLAAATWQSRRAEAAAHQSDQVTRYLTDLLASASPDRHGGQWPSVMQLLDNSRKTLPEQFRDDPETRLRLLQVLADTYHDLNRFDVAVPMYSEIVATRSQRHGPADRRVLLARFDLARSQQQQGSFDKTIKELEPLLPAMRQTFGAQSSELRLLLYVLSTSYARSGRLDEADTMLAEAGVITDAQFSPGSPERLSHLNHLQVLRAGQGRLREALAALRETEPYWANPKLENARQILVLRRNTIAIQIRLGEYNGVEARCLAVLEDMERLLGPGNDMAQGLRHELARYFTEVGQGDRALAQRQDNLARAVAAKIEAPGVLIPLQVQVLLAQAQARSLPALALQKQARQLLAQMAAQQAALGYARADAWINLSRVGLLLDDAALAEEALQPLRSDAGLNLQRDMLLASRVAQQEAGLARLQGDLPRSRRLLLQRLQVFERPGEKRLLPAWVTSLDLAFTLVLLGDPGAAAALDAASARRPSGAPAGHPLDVMHDHLRARLAGGPNTPAPRGGAGLGSFSGALI